MATELPSDIDCRRLLRNGGLLTGAISGERFERIGGIFRPCGAAQVHVQLSRDEQGQMALNGSFVAPLQAQCQRCLEWMELEVSGDIELDVVPAAHSAEDEQENLLRTVDGRLQIVEFVEDEVLLACPMIPLHAAKNCRGEEVKAASPPTPPTRQPFAGLGDLLGESNDDFE
jgi:uncharacterized protein